MVWSILVAMAAKTGHTPVTDAGEIGLEHLDRLDQHRLVCVARPVLVVRAHGAVGQPADENRRHVCDLPADEVVPQHHRDLRHPRMSVTVQSASSIEMSGTPLTCGEQRIIRVVS